MAAVLQSIGWSNTWEQLKLFSKRCCACGRVKDLEEFHFCARAPDHRQYQCRSCRAEYDRRRKLFVVVPETAITVRLHWKPPDVSVRYTSTLPVEAFRS
jgi:hypothetical protein